MNEIMAFAKANNLQPGTVVQNAKGGSGITWQRWLNGGDCWVSTQDRILAYIRANE